MSLKHFHMVFIAASLGLMAFLVSWSLHRRDAPLAGVAILGLLGGLGYLRWFVREHRALP